ncbi:BgTH12-00809 [Blumeria graminis f. sp. triticale]|uniref:rRNA methyltransferase 2, mitochondrial n=3 Tax=Blumeria graminis TaxID=34373 RepID=A0A381LDY9_BLUGR|nr:Mitochondrial 2' O-ribose methyltransferase [Blumeria graminis f. sp. tritici 96224]CAD6505317.1 BgTH12-00809 [Blumeria graminis f. sp. triticale]VDB93329.1 Bgt-5311 [Blumeria graminis f. sp. tritici]
MFSPISTSGTGAILFQIFPSLPHNHRCRIIQLSYVGLNARKACLRNSSSSSQWKNRQSKDPFAKEARVRQLKSRAAFKLLELDSKYTLFKRGQTVVDLGYAPGSWSQVAKERTKPNGRVLGIDILPASPPSGVSTIQGDFLTPGVQAEVKKFLSEIDLGRCRPPAFPSSSEPDLSLLGEEQSYLGRDREEESQELCNQPALLSQSESYKVVDVVLSDMSEPWEIIQSHWNRTLSDPYRRLMNTSGIKFKDHAGSMDLCNAALNFAQETLKVGGHFVCKFYQGSEDHLLETKLRKLFRNVYRQKPDSSRNGSREAYLVSLNRLSV